jgi:hypothetical protein
MEDKAARLINLIKNRYNLALKRSFIEELINEILTPRPFTEISQTDTEIFISRVIDVMVEERMSNLVELEEQNSLITTILMEEFFYGVLERDHVFKIMSAINVAENRENQKTHGNNAVAKIEITDGM